jgi:TPP-dependent pyruvate/acetoin dehydrogenase alpha subunit
MRKTTLTDHDAVKRAAQYILKNGLASYAEIAAISGRNRQTVRLWAQQLNAESARQDYLAKLWREALQRSR